MSNERRKDTRRPLLRMCWLDLGKDHPPLQARLINVSKSGARIDCAEPDKMPDDVVLYLTEDGKVGRRCRVVRRSDAEVGLEFINKPAPAPSWQPPETSPERL